MVDKKEIQKKKFHIWRDILIILGCIFFLIIIFLVIIDVLSPLGRLPKTNVPYCVMGMPFGCAESKIMTDKINLTIINGAMKKVEITKIEIKECGSIESSVELEDREQTDIEVPCSSSLLKGERFESEIWIYYKIEESEILKNATGRIIGKVK